MKRNGVSNDDRTVFICAQCHQVASELHEMQDDIFGDDQRLGDD